MADDGATDDPGAIFEPPTADPASKDPNFLELRGVEKRFGENKVLNGIDLTVGQGVIREQGPPDPRTQAFLKRIIDAGPF